MTTTRKNALRKAATIAPLSLAIVLGGCFDDDDVDGPPPTPTPTMTPTPTPDPVTYDVSPCLNQEIPGTGGTTVAQAVVPDTLTLNLGANAGFPNGRLLPDPVIDVTLAVIFLDLTTESPLAFANLPLNPPENDVAFQDGFPFLAEPQGAAPMAPSDGSGFTFRDDGPDAYERVDRMGMPAVATALIGSDQKIPYNDADPSDDAEGDFVPEITEQLTGLTNALADDLVAADFTPCAVPDSDDEDAS